MTLGNKLLGLGMAGLGLAGIGIISGVAVKDHQVVREIENHSVASKLWYTQNATQRYAGAFDDDKDGKEDRIILRELYSTGYGSGISFREVRRSDPDFQDLLGQIRK